MDPLTAFSVASSVVQFIQFGCSLVSQGQEIYDSHKGALLQHIECEDATNRLVELTNKLRPTLRDARTNKPRLEAGNEDVTRAIEDICDNCLLISRDLITLLDKLRIKEKDERTRWKSFRHALHSIWSKGDLDAIEKRLLSCQKELDSHLIVNIKAGLNALHLGHNQLLALVKEETQKILQAQLDNNELLANRLLEKCIKIIQSDNEEYSSSRQRLLDAAETKILAIQSRLVGTLKFPAMTERRDSIDDAHRRTFEWVFRDDPDCQTSWSSFVEWLQHGAGVYWINGKAGSGKSTLMRFILEDERTVQNLRCWTNDTRIKTGEFFFWQSGTKMQRSQTGLFRSLLYEALVLQPELVPEIFPQEWLDARSAIEKGQSIHDLDWSWPLKTLQEAFSRLTNLATASMKFCFFIDGLDEFEGDHRSLAYFFNNLSVRPHIKLCVSSRPWLVFEHAFRPFPSLKLQDLTYNDIMTYTRDELEEHSGASLLSTASVADTSELVREIVTKANGVFLWVKLVVRSLLRGLQNNDDISDLHKRLIELPNDLSALYKIMIHQIEPLYWQQAAKIFQIFSTMVEVQGATMNISPLELDLAVTATSAEALSKARTPMDTEEICSRCERIDVQLKSRCAGLLEISGRSGDSGLYWVGNGKKTLRTLLRVSYLHRTVKEFLEAEDVRNVLFSDTASMPDFEPNTSVLMSYIVRLKRSLHPVQDCVGVQKSPEGRDIYKAAYFALKYAVKAGLSANLAYVPLLDELDKVVSDLYHWKWYDLILRGQHPFDHKIYDAPTAPAYPTMVMTPITQQAVDLYDDAGILGAFAFSNHFGGESSIQIPVPLGMSEDHGWPRDNISPKKSPFQGVYCTPFIAWNDLLAAATTMGLRTYVEMKLKHDATILARERAQPLLLYTFNESAVESLEMAKMLLKYGADPNQLWEGHSPWQHFLTFLHSLAWRFGEVTDLGNHYNFLIEKARMVKLMLQHGASSCTTCTHNHIPSTIGGIVPRSHVVEDVIIDVFGKDLPYETAELLHILRGQTGVKYEPPRTNNTGLDNTAKNQLVRKRQLYNFHGDEARKHCRYKRN